MKSFRRITAIITDVSKFGEKLEGLITEMNKNANSTDSMILFNSGSGPIKNDEVWNQVTDGIRKKLYSFSKNMRVGFIDAYRMLSKEQPENPVETYITSEWSQSSRWESLSQYQEHFRDSVDNITAQENDASYQNTFETAYDYFVNSLNASENEKVAVIISSNPFVDSDVINKMVDAGIRLDYILINENPLSNSDRNSISNMVQKTGGELHEIKPEVRQYKVAEVKERITDAVSLVIAHAMGRTDTLDSDGDGLFDCRELNGVVLPDCTVLKLNPHSKPNEYGMFDDDKDGISDAWELGYRNGESDEDFFETSNGEDGTIRLKGFRYRKGETPFSQKTSDYYFYRLGETRNNVFVMYVNAKSNPLKKDSDGDGYDDFEELNHYGTNPMESDVLEINLKNYISINTDGLTTYNKNGEMQNLSDINGYYGGNQSWFFDPVVNNDSVSERLKNGGCGLIASGDFFIYLDKYFKTAYSGCNVDGRIDFNEYNDYVRNLGEYITPRNTAQIFFDILQALYLEDLTDDLTEKLTGGLGTWGIAPEMIIDGMDDYLDDKDMELDKRIYPYMYPLTPQSVLEEEIIKSLEKNIPVIYLLTGSVDFTYSWGGEGTAKLHFVTITGIKQDNITGKTTIKCSSWSQTIYIDLAESLNSSVMLSDLLNLKGINPKDDSNMDVVFNDCLGIYHCIMFYK